MKGTILYGARDIRFEERDEPQIIEPTNAILRLAATEPTSTAPGLEKRRFERSDRTNTSYRRQINCCQGEFAGRRGTNVPVKEFQMLLG